MIKPRVNSLVTNRKQYTPATAESVYLFLGEIPNKPGHCAVINVSTEFTKAHIDTGFHTADMRELTDNEV